MTGIQAETPRASQSARLVNARITGSGLTRRQLQTACFIQAYINEHGISPSYDEIMADIGIASKSGVHRLVEALERKGIITRTPYVVRSIMLVGEGA
jgi:SOS-response transcriptional repressor LexA